ncbi:hypothetical protein PTSG_06856 [Salpingoeca rosetta]|uniref:F-box domain-containing protein n=1 Tax=Salpingoeca rosetta (strain ATCC 50818 / BSB-021) TaxID=946362 RepID=F2UF03_SALR5|nr:uncharacterized protein PTSG_06856 [Salpingoeca rosetta]EGD75203.1 hypothetical protein PTSG_06856 [Salpingoeca rosetta]|eukprot:XP_004992256.1 hypothetical protein PTSG_06856 [Salpingoeca rosetta]
MCATRGGRMVWVLVVVATLTPPLLLLSMLPFPPACAELPPLEEEPEMPDFNLGDFDTRVRLPIPQFIKDELPQDLLDKLTDEDILAISSRQLARTSGMEMVPRDGRQRREYKFGECETMDMNNVDDCAQVCMQRGYTSAAFYTASPFNVCTCSVSPSGYSTHYCGPQLMALFRPKGFPRSFYGRYIRTNDGARIAASDIPMSGSDYNVMDFGAEWPANISLGDHGYPVWPSEEERLAFMDGLKNGSPDVVETPPPQADDDAAAGDGGGGDGGGGDDDAVTAAGDDDASATDGG